MSGLKGRRVIVTRPRARAARLCAELEDRGAIVIVFPTIETVPGPEGALDHALRNLDRYDWVAFTSAAGVEAFLTRLAEQDRPVPPGIRLAAVGPATAEALEDAGVRVDAVPATHYGAALAGALGPLAGSRILVPASRLARPETAAALRAAGAQVDTVVAYDTISATPEPAALVELARGADAVTFTSPTTVTAFPQIGGAPARVLLRRAVLACIGPTTAAAVRELGFTVQVEPRQHTAPALAEALEHHFGRSSGPSEAVP